MKKILTLLLIGAVVCGYGQEDYDKEDTFFSEGLLYLKSDTTLVSGVVFIDRFEQCAMEIISKDTYKDGKKIISREWDLWWSHPLKMEVYYKDDQLHGPERYWCQNGYLIIERNYSNGKLDGVVKEWYENGKLQLERSYKNGRAVGKLTRWFEDGKIMYQTDFVNQIVTDRLYDKDGVLHSEIEYKNGTIINYINHFSNIFIYDVDSVECHLDLGQYPKNGHYNCFCQFWESEMGVTGVVRHYYSNTNTIEFEHMHKEGEQDGPERSWYKNGQLKCLKNYSNGKLDGVLKEWYENGQLQLERSYKNGRAVDKLTRWFEDGKIMYQTDFVNVIGYDRIYNINGMLIEEIKYKNGIFFTLK